jgi:hypothetical protein
MTKCIICEVRPARKGKPYCATCTAQVRANGQGNHEAQPRLYLVYQGNAVGLFPTGEGTYGPRPIRQDPDSLPACRTLHLDRYCEGYTREQIKRFKAAVRQCWNPVVVKARK